MSSNDDWSGDERRQERRRILESRRAARQEDRDRQADAAAAARTGEPMRERGPDRRKGDRRERQICFVCRDAFEPTAHGQTICETCTIDGVRGGGRGWRSPRF